MGTVQQGRGRWARRKETKLHGRDKRDLLDPLLAIRASAARLRLRRGRVSCYMGFFVHSIQSQVRKLISCTEFFFLQPSYYYYFDIETIVKRKGNNPQLFFIHAGHFDPWDTLHVYIMLYVLQTPMPHHDSVELLVPCWVWTLLMAINT